MAPRACPDHPEGSLVDELKAQLAETLARIDVLTQERDEAREEVRRLRRAQYSQKKSSEGTQHRAQPQEVLRRGLSDSRILVATSSTRSDRSSISHDIASNAHRRHSLGSTRTIATSDSALQVTDTLVANPRDEPSSASSSSDTRDKGDEKIANNTTSRTQSLRKNVRFRCPSPQISSASDSPPTYEELQKRFDDVSLSSSGSKVHVVETSSRKHRSPKMKRRNSLGSTFDYFTNTNFTGRSSSDSATANQS